MKWYRILRYSYDTVSKELKTATSWTITAWPEAVPSPDTPMDIVCNNGVIKYSANMANVNEQTAVIGYYISASGEVLASASNWFYQDFISVKPNTTYTLTTSSDVYFISISEYSTADDSGFIRRNASSSGVNRTLTITTGSNTQFIRFGANIYRTGELTLEQVLAINWMLNIGNSMNYQPYVEGGIYTEWDVETIESTLSTATAEMLLKVGDYVDEQEILSWDVTRKIGIKVLDGTENWVDQLESSNKRVNLAIEDIINDNGAPLLVTHGVWSISGAFGSNMWRILTGRYISCRTSEPTLADFKTYLTAQYNAWTPVIVIYPLATPTTETVAGQTMDIPAWNSIIEITQASIDDLWLYAKYKATA